MKTADNTNPINSVLDSVIDAQSKVVNNWVETTQKAQKAILDGKSVDKNSDLYKEWLDNQMGIFKNISVGATDTKEGTSQQDFFKNWYNTQLGAVKQMTDFNQNLYNTMLNFGKNNNDIQSSFGTMNGAWTGVYNNWMSSLNNTYDTMSKNMNGGISKDAFSNMFNSNNVMFKMFELYQPLQKNFMNGGTFDATAFKTMFDAAKYKDVMDNMFESFSGKNNVKEIIDTYVKNIENYFTSNNLGKEYFTNMQDMFKKMPELMSGDFAKVNQTVTKIKNAVVKAYEPLLNLVQEGKEKETLEQMINTVDKAVLYNVKQAQMQYLMYNAGQKSMEKTVEMLSSKMKEKVEVANFQTFFNEWVNTNEKVYLDLFNSDEFSTLKAEVLDLSLTVKKSLETQFTSNFEQYPFVFKNEMEEVYKTMYDLKKTIKNLQAKLAEGVVAEEETTTKTKKATK